LDRISCFCPKAGQASDHIAGITDVYHHAQQGLELSTVLVGGGSGETICWIPCYLCVLQAPLSLTNMEIHANMLNKTN
jgi:hypothetical protein